MTNSARRKSYGIAIKILAIVCAAFLLFTSIKFAGVSGGVQIAHAADETATSFDETDVMADLESSEDFDILKYPYDSTGLVKHPSIFNVVEYCYSIRPTQREHYGLYVYFYNPQALNISTASRTNKIMLGVSHDDDRVTDYEKFELEFCSKSDGDYRDLFYKFKIIDHRSADGKTVEERVNSNARRYDISEIELLTYGDKNATAYGVGGTFTFTGYAKGYGPDANAESNLVCARTDLETIELKTTSTFYRTGEYKTNYQHDLSSVYFAVPTEFFEKYSTLQKIKAEWYEYVTSPIVITSNDEIYSLLDPYIGKNIGKVNYDEPLSIYTGFKELWSAAIGDYFTYDWVYNAISGNAAMEYAEANEYCERLNWLFSTNGSDIAEYVLSAARIQEYIAAYDRSNDSGYLSVPSKDINADLFEAELSAERASVAYLNDDIHHKQVNFDASDTFDMLNYDESNEGWQKFFAFLFGLAPSSTDDSYKGISPIHVVTEDDIAQTDLAKRLLIDGRDEPLQKFKDFYNLSTTDNNFDGKPDNKVVLFRFAQTDFMRLPVIAYNNHTLKNLSKNYGANTYVVQESVFFDFDIIELTFSKEGKYYVIPAVSSPIDIINDITLPAEECDWPDMLLKALGILLAVIAIVVIIIFLWPILSPILNAIAKGLIWLFSAPFKWIWKKLKKKE